MKIRALALAIGVAASGAVSAAGEVEVLHWWTSGGEAAALNVLKDDLSSKGVSWADMPVAGGGGESAMTVLRARVTSNNAPTAAQMLGYDILDWGAQGAAADLNSVAAKEGWDAVVPAALQNFAKYDGNWVWANKEIFDELGLSAPINFDELVATLEAIKKAGYTPLAHGGQAWQEATIFDSVVLATGGVAFYRKALVDLDADALGSDTMKTVFDRMAILRSYVDDNFSGRDWNLASAMVIEKKAGMQVMGDWAKGEFLNAGKKPGEDFMCFRFPGTSGAVTFNSDQFMMFKVGSDRSDAQNQLASSIMAPSFQSAFNVVKGSVPARTDVSDADFDACGKKGMRDLASANANNTLLGSLAHGHAAPASVKNAMYDVITAHFNGEYSSADAVAELVSAVDSAK
ncbi:MAG: ABC transporter substrate-binding protein [Gimesia sp.]|nr:ABC transporter substrate-binding protein [Gimesia sp.]